jgi:hypothetical protein
VVGEFIGRIRLAIWRWSRRRAGRPQFEVGAYYSIRAGEHSFCVAKILVQDDWAVHIRSYADTFSSRPVEIDPSKLTMGSVHKPEEGVGLGHLPLTPEHFNEWEPVLLLQGEVTDDELDGYREWKEARGGIFGEPWP